MAGNLFQRKMDKLIPCNFHGSMALAGNPEAVSQDSYLYFYMDCIVSV